MSKHVKLFQAKHGLVADGKIGRLTLAKMRCVFGGLTDSQLAHFLANVDVETGNFERDTENLNYSALRLKQVFPKYFPNETLLRQYAGNPIKIASRVYGGRMGNGNEASGDGWKYIGRGSIQLTGKDNYKLFSNYVNRPEIMLHPEIVAHEYFWESGLFYFQHRGLWEKAKGTKASDVKAIRKLINGGTHGLNEVQANFTYYYNLITK